VHTSAILRRDGRTYVLRVDDGIVTHAPVRVGIRADDQTEILTGVSVGDVVIHGEAVPRLADGARVTLPEAETAVSAGGPDRG
jgi:multidrug efflux pump subunit AcrA (membrane-fusion protein)